MKISRWLTALLFAGAAFGVQAAPIDATNSRITATFTQMGVKVDAKFNTFEGSIDFDSANPAAAQARIVVQVASFDIGDAEYNKEVLKKEWFNAAQFPQATFVTTAIKANGANQLQAQGKLTIKGKALAVTVPIAVERNGNEQRFQGSLPIKRLYFNIGEGEWQDTSMLADEVVIKFNLVTRR